MRSVKQIISLFAAFCILFCMLNAAASAVGGPTLGDPDGDGAITPADARFTLRAAVGLEVVTDGSDLFKACDVDKDGLLQAADARLILRASVGLETLADNGSAAENSYEVLVGGSGLKTGMSLSDITSVFGKYTRKDTNMTGIDAYSFTKDYSRYFIAYMKDGKAVAYYISGTGFECGGYKQGDRSVPSRWSVNDGETANAFCDQYNGNALYAVLITANGAALSCNTVSPDYFSETSKQIFDMTNAFRVQFGLPAYLWNDIAAETAHDHSADLAENNYFDHYDRSGGSPGDRLEAHGLTNWCGWAENISAGYCASYDVADQWIHSSGHRSNMLGDNTYLGVGGAYGAGSTYRWYWTQNFVTLW